jgi:riboflavin synthase alpha subunit
MLNGALPLRYRIADHIVSGHVSVHTDVFETHTASDMFTEVGRHATHDTAEDAPQHAGICRVMRF